MIVLLLFALTRAGNQSTEIEKNEIDIQKLEEKLDKRFDKLEKDIKKIKISKAKQQADKLAAAKAPTPIPVKLAVVKNVVCEQYRPLFTRYDWDVNIAMAIMQSESNCNPNAHSPTNDYGLMQLHGIAIFDPAKNVEYAYYNKYLKGGWGHWTDYNNGNYLRFL